MGGWFDENLVTIINGIAIGLLIYTMAVGMSLVFGMMNVLNLAHGAIFLLGSYIAYTFTDLPGGFLVAIVVALFGGGLVGLVLSGATGIVGSRGHLDQAVLTLGIAMVGAEAIASVWGNDVKSVPPPVQLSGTVSILGQPYPSYRLGVIVIGLLLSVAVYWVIDRTHYGVLIRAAVADRVMTSACGVNTHVLLASTFAAGTALAAFGGVLSAPILGASRGIDNDVLILALIVVIVGGLGSARGALIGALIVGQVRSLGVVLLPDAAPVLLFVVLTVIMIVRPQGIAGRKELQSL